MVRTLQQQFNVINSCIDWWWDNWVKPENISWECLSRPIPHLEMIHWTYRYGVSKNWFNYPWFWDYPTFEKYVLAKQYLFIPKTYKERKRRWIWYDRSYSTKYQKGEGHGKREGVDEKQFWREVSGKNRDYRKSKYRRGAGRYWKKLGQSEHRAFVRQNIHHENWDVFHDKEYMEFADPWRWD